MKKRLSIFWILSFLMLAAILLPLSAAATEMKPVKLRVASAYPPPANSMASYAAQLWMDEIEKKTNGKVSFQVFWGGALGKPAEHNALLEREMVDLVLTHRWYTPTKFPLSLFEYVFPFGPVDPLMVVKAKRQIYDEFPQFAQELAKYNAVMIFNGPGLSYEMLSKTPVNKLEDLKGKKVSLVGRYFGKWVEAGGATPVVAPAGDRYTMLQTGIVDMDFLPMDLFAAFKIQEQAKHLIKINALTACWYDLLISAKTLHKLPADVQKIMLEAGKEIELRMATQILPEWDRKIADDFKKAGVTVINFPATERAKWANAVEDVPAQWAEEVTKEGLPGWQIIERYQQLTTEMGYKWPRQWGKK